MSPETLVRIETSFIIVRLLGFSDREKDTDRHRETDNQKVWQRDRQLDRGVEQLSALALWKSLLAKERRGKKNNKKKLN